MSFAVQMVADSVQVEPGSSIPVAIEVTNRADATDHFELSVEGIDPEWTAVPVPTFSVAANETHVERFFLKPPRESGSQAGNYPFVVKIRSLESGESRTVQGILEVKPYHHLSVDVLPRRVVVSPFAKETDFQVTVMNLGNTEQTLQLFANDADDVFAFEFESEQVTLGPGHQKTINLSASATKNPLLANARLQAITVTARSVANPAVAASAQGQIEQKALISPGALLALVLLVVLAGSWIAFIPKAPQVDSLSVNRQQVQVGEEVIVSWDTSHATGVELRIGEQVLSKQRADGEYRFLTDKPGELEITLIAERDDKRSQADTTLVQVLKAPEAPLPVIRRFSIEPTNIKVGQTYMVSYELGEGVTRAVLSPVGQDLDIKAGAAQLTAGLPGTFEYKLIAYNADGKSVEKSITVKIVQASLASIVKFEITPKEVDPADGRVSIVWQFSNAARAELRYNGQDMELDPVEQGRRDVTIEQDTEFTLTIYDAEGRTVVKKVAVKMKKVPSPVDPATTGTGGSTGTTGGGAPPTGTTGN